MTTQNAIKRIEKAGYIVKQVSGRTYQSIIGAKQNRVLEFIDQHGEVICIGVRGINDQSDPMSDYCAFTFYENLTRALKFNS